MATLVKRFTPPPPGQWARRMVNSWRTFFAPGDLTALLITFGLLLVPMLALEAAGWPLERGTVLPILVLATLFGFMLARSHYNELVALVINGIYGSAIILIIAAVNEPGGIGTGIYDVVTRLVRWMVDATTGGINQDELVFVLLVSMLFCFLAYNVAWHIFRIDRVWRAVLPPGLILVANSIYYTGEKNLDLYVAAFMFLSLLLVVRSNLDAREWDWYVNGIRVPKKLRGQFFRVGGVLALVTLLVASNLPSGDLQDRLDRFQDFLRSEPLTQLSELWNRLFTTVETQGPTTADYYGGDSLQLGGAIRLGDQVIMLADAPPGRRYYWRSRVFDTYEAGRWTPAANTRLTDPESPLDIQQPGDTLVSREPVQQQFTIGLNASRLIYTAPQPSLIDLPTRTDLSYTAEEDMNVSVIRPLQVLYRGDTYTATSLMSNATASQLRAAGSQYPEWVTSTESPLYLYVSPSITDRTVQLANDIINNAGATNNYDKAKAIEGWLRTNILYNESIPQPPAGQDPVDWVLFDFRQGYCNYYASSMVMMLRSIGIPARMAAGFAQGTWDAENNVFVVRERDAHTWVEVYFPGYGWIEFEPTAAQAPLNRVDDVQLQLPPTSTPINSPTPTVTPSPTVTPTATPGQPTPEPQQGQLFPTVTPTPSPTPTATPVIVPTQPPPLRPQPRGPLSQILPALGIVLLVLLVVVVLIGIAVFLWWWWEWRGMRGYSPVVRAYARLERYLGLIGIELGRDQTPEERRLRIIRDIPAAEPPVTAITRMYTVEKYGRGPQYAEQPDVHADVADEAWSETRTSILRRWLRRLLPWRMKE
ncbi:MAG: transglutaminase domain-containing protein [Burkholderiales bacterium]|nr:transglutaminase domain-containing protein [Anaerolineae bacterium]